MCAPARTHVRTRKLKHMHAISAALELHIGDLSPFALCAPSILLPLNLEAFHTSLPIFRKAELAISRYTKLFRHFSAIFSLFEAISPHILGDAKQISSAVPILFHFHGECQSYLYFINRCHHLSPFHLSTRWHTGQKLAFCTQNKVLHKIFHGLNIFSTEKITNFAIQVYFTNSAWQNKPT